MNTRRLLIVVLVFVLFILVALMAQPANGHTQDDYVLYIPVIMAHCTTPCPTPTIEVTPLTEFATFTPTPVRPTITP